MIERSILERINESRASLRLILGEKLGYVLLTDAETDYSVLRKDKSGKVDIYLTVQRTLPDGTEADIFISAVHEAAHALYSFNDYEIVEQDIALYNLLEDLYANTTISRRLFPIAAEKFAMIYAPPPQIKRNVDAVFKLLTEMKKGVGITPEHFASIFPESEREWIAEWWGKVLETSSAKKRHALFAEFIERYLREEDEAEAGKNGGTGSAKPASQGGSGSDSGSGSEKDEFEALLDEIISFEELQKLIDKMGSQGFTTCGHMVVPQDYEIISQEIINANLALMDAQDKQMVLQQDLVYTDAVMEWRDSALEAEYETLLKIKSSIRRAPVHGTHSGSISTKKLHLLPLAAKGVPAGIFKSRIEPEKSGVFVIVLDASASMDVVFENVSRHANALFKAAQRDYHVIGVTYQGTTNGYRYSDSGIPDVEAGGGTPTEEAFQKLYEFLERYKTLPVTVVHISDKQFSGEAPQASNVKLFTVAAKEQDIPTQVSPSWNPVPYSTESMKEFMLKMLNFYA